MTPKRVDFTLHGRPAAWQRARAQSLPGGGVRMFNSKKLEQREGVVASAAINAMRDAGLREPFRGAVALHVAATFEIAKSWPRWKRAAALAGRVPMDGPPDIDNLSKLLQDSMNGIVFADDRQIVELRVVKRYGELASTRVIVEERDTQIEQIVSMPDLFVEAEQ